MVREGANGREVLARLRKERGDSELTWDEINEISNPRDQQGRTTGEVLRRRNETVYNNIISDIRKPKAVSEADWEDTKDEMKLLVNDAMSAYDRGTPVRMWVNDGRWVSPNYTTLAEKYGERVAQQVGNSFARLLKLHTK